VPMSVVTTVLIGKFGTGSDSMVESIKFWLGIALLVTSLSVLFRHELTKSAKHESHIQPKFTPVATVILGMFLGFIVTLTSVGAGALGVTALLLLYPHEHINRIVGSDVAHAVPLTLVAGLGHASLGTVDYGLLGMLLIGSIPGIWIGSHMTNVVGEVWVRNVLALILVYVGQKLAFPEINQLLGLGLLLAVAVIKQIVDSRTAKVVTSRT